MSESKYKLSVIMPIYNTERYLKRSIECLINQSLGFENNIELILVNNASEDNADSICRGYLEKYSNIKYVVLKKNIGPSGARNEGLSIATGKYINYLDSDDIWEYDALEKLVNYLDNNLDIDIVIARMRIFGKRDIWHRMDWRFKEETKIIDIIKNPEYVQHYLCPALIRCEVAQQIKHDEEVFNEEDMYYLNLLILETGKYTLFKDAVYYHRERTSNDSALQNVYNTPSFYTTTIEKAYKELINKSKEKYKEFLPYIQYLLMYGMQSRLQHKIDCAEKIDVKAYINNIGAIIREIDDDVIHNQRFMTYEHKLFSLCLKKNHINPLTDSSCIEILRDKFPLSKGLFLKSVSFFNNKIHISGFVRYPYNEDYSLFVYNNNDNIKKLVLLEKSESSLYSLGFSLATAKDFFISIDYKKDLELRFIIKNNENGFIQKIQFDKNGSYDEKRFNVSEEFINCI